MCHGDCCDDVPPSPKVQLYDTIPVAFGIDRLAKSVAFPSQTVVTEKVATGSVLIVTGSVIVLMHPCEFVTVSVTK